MADDYTPEQTFDLGARVELHPSCDLWMRGACFGNVTGWVRVLGEKVYKVQLDNVRKVARCRAEDLRGVR